jgi:Excisionase from transposon Tn916.
MNRKESLKNLLAHSTATRKGKCLMKDVPIWEKSNLTLEEAAAYSGIGINKLREITNEDKCKFVLWVGNKRLIKRRLFDCFVEQAYSI